MGVVACGPVASGTRMLYRIIKDWGVDVTHRSMPQWETFWSWDEWPDDTRFVVITRRPDVSTRSAFESGHGRHTHERVGLHEWRTSQAIPAEDVSLEDMEEWWSRAMKYLADFPIERTHWVSYEALVESPHNQAFGIARFLGLDRHDLLEPIRDGNAKWLRAD